MFGLDHNQHCYPIVHTLTHILNINVMIYHALYLANYCTNIEPHTSTTTYYKIHLYIDACVPYTYLYSPDIDGGGGVGKEMCAESKNDIGNGEEISTPTMFISLAVH